MRTKKELLKMLENYVREDYGIRFVNGVGTEFKILEKRNSILEDIKKEKENKMAKVKIDINNADHPSRKKAINILEYIAEYMGDEDMFDCKETDCGKFNTRWYDLEDKLTHIIEGIE